mgnify:CR=1 FL=1
MDENRKKYSAEEKKDYYVPVMLCQILLTGVFLLFVFMLVNGKSGNSVKEELDDMDHKFLKKMKNLIKCN